MCIAASYFHPQRYQYPLLRSCVAFSHHPSKQLDLATAGAWILDFCLPVFDRWPQILICFPLFCYPFLSVYFFCSWIDIKINGWDGKSEFVLLFLSPEKTKLAGGPTFLGKAVWEKLKASFFRQVIIHKWLFWILVKCTVVWLSNWAGNWFIMILDHWFVFNTNGLAITLKWTTL